VSVGREERLKVLLIKRETGRERRKDKTGKKEDVDD
jgi:hypothetical protein